MRAAATAIAWEFWSANRRGWLIVIALMIACALFVRVYAASINDSEGMRFLTYFPMVISVILSAGFCNFTDRTRRDGIAGFPRHLFALPVSTLLAVSCAFACGLLSVVGVYIAWAGLVLQPLHAPLLVRWPATLLAAGVVFYQAILWCLCGFRLTRIISLSLVATTLVGIGCVPTLNPSSNLWATESRLTTILIALMTVAYSATVVTVEVQRRGGARGWTGIQYVVDTLTRAVPRRQTPLKSADAALFWMEWRRSALVLPAAVTLMTCLILGPVIWFTGAKEKETLWAEMWLFLMPMLLAFPIGLGFGKPDFWILDVTMSPFSAARPVSAGQLIAAKLKAAAVSAIVAWTILLVVAPTWIYFGCDTTHWSHLWTQSGFIYSPVSHYLLPILAFIGAMLITWSLLVRNLWLGYSGRPALFYVVAAIGLAMFVAAFFWFIWWLEHPRHRGTALVGMMPWIPWAIAAVFTAKIWTAALLASRAMHRKLVSQRTVATYAAVWLTATSCLVLYTWLLAPRVEYFRNTTLLVGLCAIPIAGIALTPLAVHWNRHR
jgi:hypothetical protein